MYTLNNHFVTAVKLATKTTCTKTKCYKTDSSNKLKRKRDVNFTDAVKVRLCVRIQPLKYSDLEHNAHRSNLKTKIKEY